MAKFRKKPVVIDAVQLSWKNWAEICEFADVGGGEKQPRGCYLTKEGTVAPKGTMTDHLGMIIPTLEGDMVAKEGDWIIKGVNNELYPCKDDIFQKTYDAVVSTPLKK